MRFLSSKLYNLVCSSGGVSGCAMGMRFKNCLRKPEPASCEDTSPALLESECTGSTVPPMFPGVVFMVVEGKLGILCFSLVCNQGGGVL